MGEKNPGWTGSERTYVKNGYVMCREPQTNNRRIFEHRLVMEKHLGRKLLPTETIHHKNDIKCDNRIENLELREKSHGPGGVKSELIDELERLWNENESLKNRIVELEALLSKKSRSKLKDIKNAVKEEWGVWGTEPVPSDAPSEHRIEGGGIDNGRALRV